MGSGRVRSAVSRMYMRGRLQPASRLFKTLIASEPYPLASGRCLSGSPTLDPHRHHHILEILLRDRKSTRLNSSHGYISYAVFCLKKKKKKTSSTTATRHGTATLSATDT